MPECKYKIVYVPAETSEPVQQWEIASSRESLVESLTDRLKSHFSSGSREKTATQLQRKRAELMKNLPAGTQIDDRMLAVATSIQMDGLAFAHVTYLRLSHASLTQVENIALLSNAPEHSFVGINMYVDDEGSIKDMPINVRASDIANCCGQPVQVRGDAFLARVLDNGDDFDRMDLLVSEVSSTAQWVRDAAAQNRRKQAAASPDQLKASLLQRDATAAPQQRQQQRPLPPPPPPATSAAQAKADGNTAFAANDYEQAVQQYSKALEADPQLLAARNNRALAHLKLHHYAEAEADADAVLQAQPQNVKALLRRGEAREQQNNVQAAIEDYKAVLSLQQNVEAQRKLAAFAPASNQAQQSSYL